MAIDQDYLYTLREFQVAALAKLFKNSGQLVLCKLNAYIPLTGLLALIALTGLGGLSQAARQTDYKKNNIQKGILSKKAYIVTPERRALLNTIRFAEGTWHEDKSLGYRTLYGGGLFDDLTSHPNRTIEKTFTSAAAGAYQIIPATWNQVAFELRLSSFEPYHQDQAALHLVNKRGALAEIDSRGLTRVASSQLAKEWASFPNGSGKSEYGQPVKTHKELSNFYTNNLKDLKSDL